MTYDLQTLLLIEVDTIAALASLACGVLIWRKRQEVPDRSRIFLFLMFFSPLVCIFALSVVFKGQFTVLHSFADLQQHLLESNVLWRLFILLLVAGNALVLLLVPINYRRSSADHRWVITYVGVFTLIGILLCGWLLTRSFLLQLGHNLATLFYIIYFTWFELSERVYPRQYKK